MLKANQQSAYIQQIYVECNELRTLFLRVLNNIQLVKDVSVNTSIASTQTGSSMPIFSELANQIEKTSRKMNTEVSTLIAKINDMTIKSLRSVILNQRISKYITARPAVQGLSNRQLLQKAIANCQEEIDQCLLAIRISAGSFEGSLRQFESLINRLYLTLTSIKIEADLFQQQIQSQQESENLVSLSNSLEEILQKITQDYEVFRNHFGKFKREVNGTQATQELEGWNEKRNIA